MEVIVLEYIILLLSLTLLSLIFKIFGINIKNNKQYLLIIVIILTLFLGLRGPKVGLDMINYYKFFVIESQLLIRRTTRRQQPTAPTTQRSSTPRTSVWKARTTTRPALRWMRRLPKQAATWNPAANTPAPRTAAASA